MSARLHVLLARDRPVALILRRGPSGWYHLIRWDTATDTLQPGAWFRGRIYEERCSLSPDGELLLYFALQGRKWGTSYRGAWSAVSRAPWLHALTLWPQGHTWGGGGTFLDRRTVALTACAPLAHPDHPLRGLVVAPPTGARCGIDSLDFPPGEWSGRDLSGAPVFTRAGCLYRVTPSGEQRIADLNGLAPDPQPAPEWARAPLPELTRRKKRAGGPGRTRTFD